MTRTHEAGFTTMELVVGMAVVGGLATVALPSFSGETQKARMRWEVNAVIAELRLREASHFAAYGMYVSTASSEADAFPTAPSEEPVAIGALPTRWQRLGVELSVGETMCSYVVIGGNDNNAVGPVATSMFGFVKPASRSWFYVLAHCLDGGEDAYFFASHDDGTVRELGEPDVIRGADHRGCTRCG